MTYSTQRAGDLRTGDVIGRPSAPDKRVQILEMDKGVAVPTGGTDPTHVTVYAFIGKFDSSGNEFPFSLAEDEVVRLYEHRRPQ